MEEDLLKTNYTNLLNIGHERALTNNNKELDNKFLSLKELTTRPLNILSKATKTERTLLYLKQLARDSTRL